MLLIPSLRVFVCLCLVLCSCNLREDVAVINTPASKTGFQSWNFVDPQRSVTLTGFLWYPVSPDVPAVVVEDSSFRRAQAAVDAPVAQSDYTYPLIVLVPGDGLGPDSLAWLAELLVSNGYVVAAVQPAGWKPSVIHQTDLWGQPKNVSALLTNMEGFLFGEMIDHTRVGLVSFGSGSLTAVWLAGGIADELTQEQLVPPKGSASQASFGWLAAAAHSADIAPWKKSYRDSRITNFVMLAPSFAWIFKEHDLKKITAAFYIIAGEDDKEVDTGDNAVRFAQWIPQAQFTALQGHVGHWDFLSAWSPIGLQIYKTILPKGALPSIPLEHRREGVHMEVGGLALRFFNQEIK